MICKECQEHKQLTHGEFEKLPFRLARQVDCKNVLGKGIHQCTCYSIEHAIDKEEIRQILDLRDGGI